jgi:hypothetical protein
MKVKTLSATKSLALSSGIGIAFVLLLFSVSGGNSGSLFFVFLRPGAFFAERAGYGAHDMEGLLLYVVGNMAFYVVIVFFVLRLVVARRLARNRQDPASGPTNTTTTR